jgi:hypothetical protein
MSNVDKLVATDLIALAVDDRRQLPSFADALRVLPSDKPAPTLHAELLPLANAYSLRIAQGAWGAAALVWVWALVVLMHVSMDWGHPALVRDTLDQGHNVVLVWIFATATAGYARRIAERRFARFVYGAANPVEAGARMVEAAEPWSIVIRSAGVTSLVVLFGVVFTMVQNRTLFWFPTVPQPLAPAGSWNPLSSDFIVSPANRSYDLERLRDVRIAMIAIAAFAVLIGRSYVRHGRPVKLLVRVRWIAVFVSVAMFVAAFDLGNVLNSGDHTWVLTIVTALGAGSLLIAVASFAVKDGSRLSGSSAPGT